MYLTFQSAPFAGFMCWRTCRRSAQHKFWGRCVASLFVQDRIEDADKRFPAQHQFFGHSVTSFFIHSGEKRKREHSLACKPSIGGRRVILTRAGKRRQCGHVLSAHKKFQMERSWLGRENQSIESRLGIEGSELAWRVYLNQSLTVQIRDLQK